MSTESISKNKSLITLDKDMLQRFKPYITINTLCKGNFVFQASTPKKCFYIVLKGRVKLFRVSEIGREITQWFCFPGEIFGLAESPETNQHSIFAQCCEPCEVIAIPLNQFNNFIQSSPDVALKIIEQLSVRLKIVGDTLLDFTSDDVKTRLVKLLKRLNKRFGVTHNDGVIINIVLTHKEISDMIGACRQSVTTALGELKAEGNISLIDNRFFIPSVEKFEKLGTMP
ncbi:MAG: Crp/Fnr family transcriptional regulator [Gammaproteobacteria bacterium]|nr:Crp/Fnr family transcriptional regulator [Gammaproteobacteria bacterium]